MSSFAWEWFLGGSLVGILAYKIIANIRTSREVLRIEKKQLHWTLTDKLTRREEMLTLPDGVKLQAYIYDSDMTPKVAPSILFLHGMGGFAQDFNFEPMLSALALAGYRVFAYDFRASGRSRKPTDPTIFQSLSPIFIQQIFEDPKTAIDWMIHHEGVDPQRIGIVGASLGGTMALGPVLHDPRIKMIIGICAPYDMAENIDKNFIHGPFIHRFLFKFLTRKMRKPLEGGKTLLELISEAMCKYSPVSFIRSDYDYTKRVFIAQSKVDEILPFELNFPRLVEKMRLPPEQTIALERGGHEFKGQTVALLSRAITWLKNNL